MIYIARVFNWNGYHFICYDLHAKYFNIEASFYFIFSGKTKDWLEVSNSHHWFYVKVEGSFSFQASRYRVKRVNKTECSFK